MKRLRKYVRKYSKRILSLTFVPALAAGIASAATSNIPQVQHVIVVIQENRTPDNLFHEDTTLVNNGADVIPNNETLQTDCNGGAVAMSPAALNACWDPDHSHAKINKLDGTCCYSNGAWEKTYDNGKMDGACMVNISGISDDCSASSCNSNHSCPYTYVDNTVINPPGYGVLQPYFDMAAAYGFANYTFQTNQGPSFEAHQFLFSGTSAPTNPGDSECGSGNDEFYCYLWFASELDPNANDDYGCSSSADVAEVNPNRNSFLNNNNIYMSGKPCYPHNSLALVLDDNNITWGYYAQGPTPATSLWTAPNSIQGVCYASGTTSGPCNGPDWQNYVEPHFPPPSPQEGEMAPILTDIANCKLPDVSWVIPDGSWSDHAGTSDGSTPAGDYGPSWVSAIVNAVGNSWQNSGTGHQCDYWGGNTTGGAEQPTVIIVVWDDWGGWYDHVLPWECNSAGTCSGYTNGSGSQYVYGFRVPMLVISAYNKHVSGSGGFNGYVSGACGQTGQPTCPYYGPTTSTSQYVHDFGSILNFIEYAFGAGGNLLGLPGALANSGISPNYAYADVEAPDSWLSGGCSKTLCPYSLSDFFNFSQGAQTFVPITTYAYAPGVFENWGVNDGNVPTDPDADAYESQQ